GGLRKEMPRTYTTFILGTIALAGLPPLAGFFSKDEILASLNHGGYSTYFAIAVAGAFITAFYMTRAVVLTFFGEYRGNGHPHESDSMMTAPLIVLAGFAVTAGWVNIPGIYTGFTDWVTTRKNPIVEYHPESFDYFALTSGLLAGLAGVGLAYYVYQILGRPEDGDEKIKVEPIWNLLENKYYLDDFYFKYIINPTKSTLANTIDRFNTNILDKAVNLFGVAAIFLGNIVYNKFDQGGIDKALNISSSSTDALGARVKLLQTGKAQQYIMYFLSGVIVISLLILLVL
ncbi:proton-conducting transporter membrane subunit, partial [Acidimicrobiia bacterium]|nr:proton-conducting transporter membrane subunit [Acidimicrobiia bacterium]